MRAWFYSIFGQTGLGIALPKPIFDKKMSNFKTRSPKNSQKKDAHFFPTKRKLGKWQDPRRFWEPSKWHHFFTHSVEFLCSLSLKLVVQQPSFVPQEKPPRTPPRSRSARRCLPFAPCLCPFPCNKARNNEPHQNHHLCFALRCFCL